MHAFETWSNQAPVTLFGAWLSASDPVGAREVFSKLAQRFSEATSSEIELIAADVNGDLAYTVAREITSTTVDGQPRDYIFRVTQVYRREAGAWKEIHRHADEAPHSHGATESPPASMGSHPQPVRSHERLR